MGKPVQPEVTRLLKRGLNHYGLGDLEAAVASWEQAIVLDPKNRAAIDYLESARDELARTDGPRTAKPRKKVAAAPVAEPSDSTPRTLGAILQGQSVSPGDPVNQALALYKEGKLEEAYHMLEDVARREPSRLDVEGYLAMIRGKRAKGWAQTVGDQGRALRIAMSMEKIKKLDLRPDEGYLLGQIDGVTSVEQLLSMSRDRVRALEIVARLLRDRIVE